MWKYFPLYNQRRAIVLVNSRLIRSKMSSDMPIPRKKFSNSLLSRWPSIPNNNEANWLLFYLIWNAARTQYSSAVNFSLVEFAGIVPLQLAPSSLVEERKKEKKRERERERRRALKEWRKEVVRVNCEHADVTISSGATIPPQAANWNSLH
mgnify:CR=1 FL=1